MTDKEKMEAWAALYLPWRRMDDAPKDGRSFIAWYRGSDVTFTGGSSSLSAYSPGRPERFAITYWGRANDLDGYSAIGWVDQGRVGVLGHPEFWQPLPSSPGAVRAAKVDAASAWPPAERANK